MKFGIPVAAWHTGNPSDFVKRALESLGHQADILSQYQFYDSFKAKQHDFYFCVDSGGPLNFFEGSIVDLPMNNISMYMIDYRRGKSLKNPNDIDTCKLIGKQGGWIFQAQIEDVEACKTEATDRVSWLPLPADEEIWNSEPQEQKVYDIGFIGNIWDGARQNALDHIRAAGLRLNQPTGLWGQQAAQVLRQSRIAFNISSFFGESVAYDWNMRCSEVLSCGVPFVTNRIPAIDRLGLSVAPFIRTYSSINEIGPLLRTLLHDNTFLESGRGGRDWILGGHTYKIRMSEALKILKEHNLIQ